MIPTFTIEHRNKYTYGDGDTEVGTFSYPVNCSGLVKDQILAAMGEYNARMLRCGAVKVETTSHFLINEEEINIKQIVAELNKSKG